MSPVGPTPFAQLSGRAQVNRLRAVAVAALGHHPIEVVRLRLLNHGFNTTFRVDAADGRRFALRLNVNSSRTPANLLAETSWLRALARDTDLVVPVPQLTNDGATSCSVPCEALGRPITATVFSWLPGPDLADVAAGAGGVQIVVPMRAVGRAAATLHEHAERWSLPPGAELPAIDQPLMDVENHLDGDHALLTAARRAVIDAAFAEVQARYDELFAGGAGDGRRPLHADLHNGNLKWHRGRLAVFDFDDSGIGMPIQDLAIAAYYLRDAPALEEAMAIGYAERRALPPHTSAQFEAIVASRNLILLNDLFVSTVPQWRAMFPRYLANSILKLRAYLETGVYRHDVPGVVPLRDPPSGDGAG